MKTIPQYSLVCSMAVLLFSQNLNAIQSLVNQEGPGLEISSALIYADHRISNYTLIVYNDNQTSDTFSISNEKSVFLKLSYGHNYSLRYIKKGFIERIVMIDTRLSGVFQPRENDFDYEITMIPVTIHGNTVSDLPVAIIQYNASEMKFEYSRNYHRQIRGKEIAEVDSEN